MRHRENIVSTRFNFLVWIIEVLTGIIILIAALVPGLVQKDRQDKQMGHVFMIYTFVLSTCSPVLYYIGIEAKRVAVMNYVKNMLFDTSSQRTGNVSGMGILKLPGRIIGRSTGYMAVEEDREESMDLKTSKESKDEQNATTITGKEVVLATGQN